MKFNLNEIEVKQPQAIGVEKILTKVAIKKPNKQAFIRTRKDKLFQIAVAIIAMKEDSEFYLVSRELRDELSDEVTYYTIRTAIDVHGTVFLWPIKLPDALGKIDSWNESAAVAASIAEDTWARVSSNRAVGGYEVRRPDGDLGEPVWPEKTFQELIDLAFSNYYIDSLDHPVVKKLRGL